MFSYVKRLTGNVSVRENDGIITVEGVDGYVMERDIKATWETNRVNQNMFLHIDYSSFSFLSFYAADVLFTLETLTNSTHSVKVSLNTLTKIKQKLLEETWLSRTLVPPPKILDYSKLKEFIYTPLDFQSSFFEFYEKNKFQYDLNGFLLAASAGSGKTYTSLALTSMLDIEHVIVVCPKPALNKVWESSLETLFHKPPTYWISSSDEEPVGNEKYFVVHYEALSKMLEYAKALRNRKVAVILDESHNLNTTERLRSTYFIELCNLVKSRNTIWLSGTPIKAVSLEVIPLFRVIDPLFTKEVEDSFKKIYGKSNNRAVEILNNRLGLVSFKVEKKELNLLPPIFSEIKVKIPNAQDYTLPSIKKVMSAFIKERNEYYSVHKQQNETTFYNCLDYYRSTLHSVEEIKLYDLYRHNLKIVIRSGGDYHAKEQIMFCNKYEASKIIPKLTPDKKHEFRDTKSIIKYVGLKIQGEALGRVFGGLRAQCHVDMVEKIDFKAICESTLKKTVVFTSFTQVIEKAHKHLSDISMSPLMVYGKTNANLSSIITSFEKDESLNPLIATYKSLSTAVPLVMADTMILIDAPFRDYILTQAVSRINRLGATTQCYVYTCSLDTGEEMNISTRSFEILSMCQKAVEEIIGIKSPFVLTDNPEELEFSLEGLDIDVIESIDIKPSFINW